MKTKASGRRTRRTHNAAFKAKVALAAPGQLHQIATIPSNCSR